MTERINPRVAIIGTGFMGKALFWQSRLTPLFDCVAVYDVKINPFISFLRCQGVPHAIVNNEAEMNQALASGVLAICSDVRLITECRSLDAVVDATGNVQEAVNFCADVLNNKKNLIMINSEADLMFGPYFLKLARKNNVIYTSCDGDQPGVLKHLIDEIKLMGLQVVMAGNIKGFLNRYATEADMAGEAAKRNLNNKMCVCFTDGTKLNIEMALIANCEGLISKKKGMFGPRVKDVRDVFSCFDLNKLWNDRVPFVDYILGAEPGGGVYVIGYAEDYFQKDLLRYYKMGEGPFYLFYRHYHLGHLETVRTILDVVLKKKALMQPRPPMMTNVFAYAKKNLKAGDLLDGVGGYACYGLIENMADQKDAEGLPVCLADGVQVKKAVKKDERILLKNVEYDPARLDYAVYYKWVARS